MKILFLSLAFVGTHAFAAVPCENQIKKDMGEKIAYNKEDVYRSIFNAKEANESDKSFWLNEYQKRSLVTYETRWSAENGMYMGADLNVLDARTCKLLGTLTIWND